MLVAVEQWIGVIRDAVVTLAAGVGIYVGLKGLSTWREKLRGEQDFQLARRGLWALIRFRRSVKTLRTPTLKMVERPAFRPKDLGVFSESIIRALIGSYEEQPDRIWRRLDDLQEVAVEAEVLWERELEKHVGALQEAADELISDAKTHVRCMKDPEYAEAISHVTWKAAQDRLWGDSVSGVQLTARMVRANEALETAFRHYLPSADDKPDSWAKWLRELSKSR